MKKLGRQMPCGELKEVTIQKSEIRDLRDSGSSCSNIRASLYSYDYTRDFS